MDHVAAIARALVNVLHLLHGRVGLRTVQRHHDADKVSFSRPEAKDPAPFKILDPHRDGLGHLPPAELLSIDHHRR